MQASLFFALALAPAVDVILVPDDQPDLPAAIAAAAAGDTILVQTAADQNVFGSGVVLDKALTIVGDPVCRIDVFGSGLQLNGPGTGEVVLRNVSIQYAFGDSNGAETLYGGGFDSVRLIDCSILHDNVAGSGLITQSYPAVDLPTVQQLSAVRCNLLGGPAGSDDCVTPAFYVDGREGIRAPQASVLLVQSLVRGGRGGQGVESTFAPCPGDLAGWGGKGGDGVVAARVRSVSSFVHGGPGITWLSYLSEMCHVGGTVPCGQQPNGDPFVVSGSLVVQYLLAPPPAGFAPAGSSR